MSGELVCVYKEVGQTPLQAIEELRLRLPQYKDQKIAYAGRLDPMAEGLMLLLVGDETKNRDKYQNLDKEYEFEMILGIESDTYDLLGIVKNLEVKGVPDGSKEDLDKKLDVLMKKRVRKWNQQYPPFSAKAVKGIKLFEWARQGKLDQITIPEKEIEIYSIKKVDQRKITTQDLQSYIESAVSSVGGSFNQGEIMQRWNQFFEINIGKELIVYRFQVNCSSGTYIRGLINDVGKELECGAITYKIKRVKVGNFTIVDVI